MSSFYKFKEYLSTNRLKLRLIMEYLNKPINCLVVESMNSMRDYWRRKNKKKTLRLVSRTVHFSDFQDVLFHHKF